MTVGWNVLGELVITLVLMIDSFIYTLISSSYKIFMALAGARLLTSEAFSMIANKIYIVIGVVMLFVLSYAIIKAIIDPDQMSKGELGGPNLLKGVMVAVIGLAITPVIFNLLYQAQSLMLENNVLGKIFLRADGEGSAVNIGGITYTDESGVEHTTGSQTIIPDDYLNKTGGAIAATSIWQAFFYPASGNMDDAKNIVSAENDLFDDGDVGLFCAAAGVAAAAFAPVTLGLSLLIGAGGALACYAAVDGIGDAASYITGNTISLEGAYIYSSSEGDFGIYTNFAEIIANDSTIEYKFLVSTVVGIIVVYAFVSFSIDMGVRCAKLAYYQIIAPVPLILQILPKFKDSFNRYVSSVVSTFIEVFIRISVVYIVIYIICHITDLFSSSTVWFNNLNVMEALLARALLIVGLVIFAKQAPKIIEETFKLQSGSMSLGIGKKLADGGVFAAGAIVGGGIRQFATNTREQWAKDKPGDKRRFTRAIGSGFAGAAGAMYRSTKDQFFGPNHKQAMSWSDMTSQMSKTWDASNAAKVKHDEHEAAVLREAEIFAANAGRSKPTAIDYSMARAKLAHENIGDAVNSWTTATIDTSYRDRTLSLLQSVMDERDKLRTKTGKVEDTRLVGKMLESLQAEKIEEFDEVGYNAAVQAALNAVGPRSSYATDADYSAALKTARDSINRDDFINKDYAKQVAELQRKTNGITKLQESVQDLNALGLMLKGDVGVRAELQDYITANWSDLQARFNEEIVLEVDASGNPTSKITVKEMLENAGVDIKSGAVNFSNGSKLYMGTKIVTDVEVQRKDSSGNLEWVIDPATGRPKLDSDGNRIPVMEVEKVSYDVVIDEDTGQIREVQQKDSAGNVTFSESLTKFMERIKNANNIVNVSAKSAINTLNDQAKDGKNNIITSEEYIRTQQRKIDQQKKKNGS